VRGCAAGVSAFGHALCVRPRRSSGRAGSVSGAATRALATRDMVLAVDLDGTFLGGAERDRAALYGWIRARRASVGLIFVTGRDIPFAAGLAAEGLVPEPDLIIGDVGTTVVVGPEWTPHPHAEAWIDARWPGPSAAAAALEAAKGLRLQEGFGGRRLSYYYDDHETAAQACAAVEAAGYAALMSADLYFDVLPRGVNKGQTLLQVLAHEDVSHTRVLCAGDTMNDLSLFQTGLRGVAVGNAEPRLRAAVADIATVYCAERHGAGGILEALERFRFLSPSELGNC
jgi:hydroxymethylpyrimidine pyrophosphatase-like HAD family hydrolase